MLTALLEKLFPRGQETSREEVKRRLKLILAQDRSTLSSDTMEALRQEILQVVSRYVEIDTEGLEFSLESDRQMTALIANLPIRRVKDPDSLSESESSGNSPVQSLQEPVEKTITEVIGSIEVIGSVEESDDTEKSSEMIESKSGEVVSQTSPSIPETPPIEKLPSVSPEVSIQKKTHRSELESESPPQEPLNF